MIFAVLNATRLRFERSLDTKSHEWFFALATVGWGLALGDPIQTFKLSPSYRVFDALMAENSWAVMCFWGGFVRCVVLGINGSWFRTATLRTMASLSTLALWLAAMVAFVLAGTSTPGQYLYGLCFIFEFRCMLIAGVEAGRAERAEWARIMSTATMRRYGGMGLAMLFLIGYTRGAKRHASGPHARDS